MPSAWDKHLDSDTSQFVEGLSHLLRLATHHINDGCRTQEVTYDATLSNGGGGVTSASPSAGTTP